MDADSSGPETFTLTAIVRRWNSLRYRVAFTFAASGAVASSVLGVAFYLSTWATEQRLLEETLSAELEDYISRYAKDASTLPPSTTRIRSYVVDGASPSVPPPLKPLAPGLHHVRLEGQGFFAEVRKVENLRFMILYADDEIRYRERQLQAVLIGGVLIMTLLSAGLGSWLARRVILPVTALSEKVALLAPDQRPEWERNGLPRDEVGELERVFQDYQRRIESFIERERCFTADVSHELRTPLTIIEGAAEVLLADPALNAAQKGRVQRIARAVGETSLIASAVLSLAREESGRPPPSAPCFVADEVEDVVDAHRYILQGKPVEVDLELHARPELAVDPALLRIVIGNLVQNAFRYTQHGRVRVAVNAQGITITDTGMGMRREEMNRAFERFYTGGRNRGQGIGLSLVRRVCERHCWQVRIGSQEGRGTSIELEFQ